MHLIAQEVKIKHHISLTPRISKTSLKGECFGFIVLRSMLISMRLLPDRDGKEQNQCDPRLDAKNNPVSATPYIFPTDNKRKNIRAY